MWVNRDIYERLLANDEVLQREWRVCHAANERLTGEHIMLHAQKIKDDISIDWLRHRVNALEKQNAQLLQKVTGVAFPTPEIVAVRPGTMTVDFDTMPSFEDLGDAEAARLGVSLDEQGHVVYADKR